MQAARELDVSSLTAHCAQHILWHQLTALVRGRELAMYLVTETRRREHSVRLDM